MILDTKARYKDGSKQLSIDLSIDNIFALPKITQVSISTGLGKLRTNKDMVSYIQTALAQITGQKAVMTKAKKSIASFKVREGDLIGAKVTLRGQRMYDFLNRLVNVTLPRIRDFHGINDSQFDARGNLTIGFKDQTPFVEIGQDSLDKPFGVGVAISVKNSNKEKSTALFATLGFPMDQKLNKQGKTD